jgi:ADP-ribose pyrophosphatase
MSHEVQVREHVRIASIGAFLTLNQYTVRYAGLFGQGFSKPITRVDVYRGDSVAAILHRDCGAGRHELYLVRQFRFSTTIDPDTGAPDFSRDGRIVEIMAGSQRPEEPVRETLRRETTEETGLEIEEEIFINSFYPSPGACSEQIHLFYARAAPLVDASGTRRSLPNATVERP